MRRFFFYTLIVLLGIHAQAQAPNGYYNTASGTGYTLKTQIHNIVDGHTNRGYDALWDFISDYELDTYYENDGTVLDIYSENPTGSDPYNYSKVTNQCGNYLGEGSCYNREHSFPKSWFNDANPMYSDVHHLFPTDGYVNGQRSNLPYGEVGTASFTSDNGSKRGSARSGLGYSGEVFEPIDEFKGDLARAYFYMATRYEDVITGWSSAMLDGSADQVFETWALDMLMDWHTNDPVSQKETDRNNNAYTYQGNRNPFVDHPEWVNAIWGDGSLTPILNVTATGGSLDFGEVAAGNSSSSMSYTVSGSNLEGDISISVSAPFELSLNNNTWSGSITVSQSNAEAGENTIYVRFSPVADNNQTYATSISHSSTNASTVELSVEGKEAGALVAADGVIAFQSFEGLSSDTWIYTENPVSGTFTAFGDIWEIVTSLGESGISPSEGNAFFGGQDIENPDNPNGTFATLTFANIDLTNYENVELAFDYQAVGFDDLDKVDYYLIENGVNQSIVNIVAGPSNGTIGSTETIQVANSTNSIGLVVIVTQNGASDYCGFDNFRITGNLIQPKWTGTTSSNWSTASNWSTGATPLSSENVIIENKPTNPVINDDQAANNLEIQTGATLTIESGASLVINGTVTGNGNATIKRNTKGNLGYSIIGAPISNATLEDLGADFLYDFNGTNFFAPTGSMIPGKGYFVAFDEASPTVTFTGTPNFGIVTIPVSSSGDGFNIVSNPYSAPISRQSFIYENANDIDGNIWLWDDGDANVGADRGGDYIVVNNMGSVAIDNSSDATTGVKGTSAFNGNIGSVQGFLVKATNTSTVVFKPEMQNSETGKNEDAHFYRKTGADPQLIRLSISGNEIYNELLIGLSDVATFGMDYALDAPKYSVNKKISFFSVLDGKRLAIQALPLVDQNPLEIALGFDLAESGSFVLDVVDLQNLGDDLTITLLDTETNLSYDLKEIGTIPFETGATQDSRRFKLILSPSKVLADRKITGSSLSVFGTPEALQIGYSQNGIQELSIFTIDGKLVFREQAEFTNNTTTLSASVKSNQLYILRVGTETVKFILK